MSYQHPTFNVQAWAQQLVREVEGLQRASQDNCVVIRDLRMELHVKDGVILDLQTKNSNLMSFAAMHKSATMRLEEEKKALIADNLMLRDAVEEQVLAVGVTNPVVNPAVIVPTPVVEQFQDAPEPEPVVEQIQDAPESIRQSTESVVSQAIEAGTITPALAELLVRARAQGPVYVLAEVATATIQSQEHTDELTQERDAQARVVQKELYELLTDCHGMRCVLQGIQTVVENIALISVQCQSPADEIKKWQDADRASEEATAADLAAELKSRQDADRASEEQTARLAAQLAAELKSRQDADRASEEAATKLAAQLARKAKEAATKLAAQLARKAKELDAQKKQESDRKAKADRSEQKRREEESMLRERDQDRLARAARGKKKRDGDGFNQPQQEAGQTSLNHFEKALELSRKVSKAADMGLVLQDENLRVAAQDENLRVAAQVEARRAQKKLQQIAAGQAIQSAKSGPTAEEAEVRGLAWHVAELMGKLSEPEQLPGPGVAAIREFLTMMTHDLTPIQSSPKYVLNGTGKKLSDRALVELYLMDRMGPTRDIQLEHSHKGCRIVFTFPDQTHGTRWTNLQTIVTWLDQEFFCKACWEIFQTEPLPDGDVKSEYRQDLMDEFAEIETKDAFQRLELKPYDMVDSFGVDTYKIMTRCDKSGHFITIPCSVVQLLLWNRMGKVDVLASSA